MFGFRLHKLSTEMKDWKEKFDLVIDNSDHSKLFDTVNEIWNYLENEINKTDKLTKRSTKRSTIFTDARR